MYRFWWGFLLSIVTSPWNPYSFKYKPICIIWSYLHNLLQSSNSFITRNDSIDSKQIVSFSQLKKRAFPSLDSWNNCVNVWLHARLKKVVCYALKRFLAWRNAVGALRWLRWTSQSKMNQVRAFQPSFCWIIRESAPASYFSPRHHNHKISWFIKLIKVAINFI